MSGGDFYVGYHAEAPPRLARITRRAAAALLAIAATIAVTAALTQGPFAPAAFEYGVTRTLEGTLWERPYPTLVVAGERGPVTYLLVDRGKHGAQARVAGLHGRRVRVAASAAFRDTGRLLQLEGDPAPLGDATAPAPGLVSLGRRRAVGEIVDGKCHLGVMVPGEGVTHRGCARRCLAGGAPPLLLTREPDGRRAAFLLVTPDGRTPGRELLPLVARPVAVHGQAYRSGDLLLLVVEPSTWESVP